METVTKLPDSPGMIGARQIALGIRSGKISHVVVASNCPDSLIQKLGDARIERFAGTQMELGTKLGRPFAIAMVGYEK